MTSNDSPKALNPPRTMLPNLMNFLFGVIPKDLDAAKSSYTYRSQNQVPKSNLSQYLN